MTMPPPQLLVEEDIEVPKGFEWIDGQAVEKPDMGLESSRVASRLNRLLDTHVTSNDLGFIFDSEAGYQISVGSSRRVRKPDLSFVARGRFPEDRIPRGNSTIAPDLAVEVISPNDTAEDIEQRIADFLSVGTRLFWVVYPATRSVWVLRRDGSAARLTEAQDLSGEDVIPGFSCPISALFAGI
jgi:Uma2 family endonuclease